MLWVRYFSSAAHKGRLVTVSKEPNKTLSSHPKFISSQYWLIFLVPALFFSLVFFTLFKSTEVTPSQLSWHWIIEICPSLREALSSRRPQPEGWRWACRAPHWEPLRHCIPQLHGHSQGFTIQAATGHHEALSSSSSIFSIQVPSNGRQEPWVQGLALLNFSKQQGVGDVTVL